MILSLSGLCLENLPAGLLRRTSISGVRAQHMIQDAVVADRLIGVFEFGAVPDPVAEKRFGQLLDALHSTHDIDIDHRLFFSALAEDPDDPYDGPSDGQSCFANPIQIFRAGAKQPMLVVSYVLTPGKNEFLDMDVDPDRLAFDLIEVISQANT